MDNELVEQFREGDERAFEELMEKYRVPLFRLAHRMVHNIPEAEELTHCTFINVYQNIGSFRTGSNFRAWLYRIAVNLCINHLKEKKRNKTVPLLEHDQDRFITKNRPVEDLEQAELQELLGKAIDSLPLEQRSVLILKTHEGLSHREIAQAMECSEKTIRWRLWRARTRLYKMLGPYLEE